MWRPSSFSGCFLDTPLMLQVRFEFGGYYASPEQLAFVPLLLIAPLPYVPLLFAAAGVLAAVPDIARNSWHRERWLDTFRGLVGGSRRSRCPRGARPR